MAIRAVDVIDESSLVPDLWESSDDDDEDVVDTERAAGYRERLEGFPEPP